MFLLNLEALKNREERLRIPLVDMALVTTLFVAVGILGVLFVTLATAWKLGWGSALLLFWNLGLFMAAGAVGFLFGHPRVARPQETRGQRSGQTTNNAPATEAASTPTTGPSNPDDPSRRGGRSVDPSTALQDIVDWLTKIIVGVGLVELKQLPSYIHRLALVMSHSVSTVVGGAASGDSFVGLSVAVIVAASGSGFIFGYLMTRLYLQGAINRADEGLSKEAESLKEQLEVSRTMTLSDDVPTDVFSVDHALWDTDPNSGKYGGSSAHDDWKLSAQVTPAHEPDKPVCNVLLRVESTKPVELPGSAAVLFHLHPSYNRPVVQVPLNNGIAELKIIAWGAFTVGAEVLIDGKKVPLELDLAKVPGGTARFYQE